MDIYLLEILQSTAKYIIWVKNDIGYLFAILQMSLISFLYMMQTVLL